MRSRPRQALLFMLLSTAAVPPSALVIKMISSQSRDVRTDGRGPCARGHNRASSPTTPDVILVAGAVGPGGAGRGLARPPGRSG